MLQLLSILAQESGRFSPFRTPPALWDYWYLLIFPLCAAIAIVYKSIRCDSMKHVPKEALQLCAFIIGFMIIAAGALAGLVHVLER